MLPGHLAIGLAAKRAAPRVSLGTWFAAAQRRAAVLLGGAVLSHWILDFVTRRAWWADGARAR